MSAKRRRSIGAELAANGVSFRVWAPARSRVSIILDGSDEAFALEREDGGYFSATIAATRAGSRYRFRLDDDRDTYPDPASRYQPEGPHGPSEVVDPSSYRWRDATWRGVPLKGAVVYEMHIGTFTREGTFASAIDGLPHVAGVGVNVIELMPLNEFAGRFGWSYDGVDLWAPAHLYGAPDDFRRFVDAAHELGVAVILDAVYNHLGPDGAYLSKFTPHYFTKKYRNDWGEAINFDGQDSEGVREFFKENAAYWIDEFHLDGLRIDATQAINDTSEPHILSEITASAHAAAGKRQVILIAENEPEDIRLVSEYGLDAMWNDDWHHAASVASSGRSEAYYTDYRGTPQEFVSMAKFGFLYQGQRYKWQKDRRGTPSLGIAPGHFVCFLQNHDQVANSAYGQRIHQLASPGTVRALTALLFLQPQTPMLFQGQEFASSAPFLYFADHKPDLAEKVAEGRREFLVQFPSLATILDEIARPSDPRTFERCKLDFAERDRNRHVVDLHRDLIELRRGDPVISQQRSDNLHGSVIGHETFLLRWVPGDDTDRLLIVNLGGALNLDPAPEPLLAPPKSRRWVVLWSSESPRYGGAGTAPLESDTNWNIPPRAAVLLRP